MRNRRANVRGTTLGREKGHNKMQIGEAIAVTISTPDQDEPCWACKQEPEVVKDNLLVEEPSSLGEHENDLHNDSSKLGESLGFRPEWHVTVPDPLNDGKTTVRALVTPAAHHLIPGNASLKQAVSLLPFIAKSKGKITSDIGYNVNSAKNGVWLPGSYGVKKDSTFQTRWSQYEFQGDYAFAAMNAAKAQFHDSHPEYSSKVLDVLDKLAAKMKLHAPDLCGICKEKVADKSRPPYGLVGRLDRVSGMHKKFLRGPDRKWPVTTGYFTSAWSGIKKSSATD